MFAFRAAVACLVVAGLVGSAHAHALHAQAKLEKGKVVVEAKFDGDEPADKAKVYVIDEAGDRRLQGHTGSDGQLRFDVPPPGKYQILVDAGAGHLAKVAVVITTDMQPGPVESPDAIIIGEGQTIEEAERSRWWKLAIGLIAIAAFAAVLKLVLSRRQTPTVPSP